MLIIHGENQVASRDYFISLKTSFSNKSQVTNFQGQDLTLADLTLAVGSSSLFDLPNIIFIESFFSRRPGSEKQKITDYLSSHLKNEIYLWEPKDVAVSLKAFPASSQKVFKLPQYLFQFLDDFSLVLLNSVLKNVAPEQLLFLLVRQIHRLIVAKSGIKIYPSWQLQKLSSQASEYSLPDLINLLKNLLQIEYSQKTSSPPFNLGTALELWTIQALK